MKKRALVVALLAALTGAAHATDLKIGSSGNRAIVSWPQAATNDFYLEYTTGLIFPVTWRPAADPVANGSSWVVTNETADTGRFYRLETWEVLFDGSSTSAFRGYQQPNFPGTSIWKVTASGELEAVTGGASVDFITTNQYADFAEALGYCQDVPPGQKRPWTAMFTNRSP